MNLIKSLKARKAITCFFILSFTIAILTFSVGSSAIISQQNKAKEYSPDNNKFLVFLECTNINFDEIVNLLKDTDASFILNVEDRELGACVESIVLGQDVESTLDLKEGVEFTEEENMKTSSKALFSTRFDEESLELIIPRSGEKFKVDKSGKFYEISKKIILPYGAFKEIYLEDDINFSTVNLILRADKDKIEGHIKTIEEYVKKKNPNNSLKTSSYMTQDKSIEGEALYSASFTIIFITIINSISISSLWVKSRKKEIVLRKVFGATDKDISKIFFSELLIISITSVVFALIIQLTLSVVFEGSISTIDIRLNLSNFIISTLLAVVTALLVSIPSLKHIAKVQPIEILREN